MEDQSEVLGRIQAVNIFFGPSPTDAYVRRDAQGPLPWSIAPTNPSASLEYMLYLAVQRLV
jgi:hypothetical protein